MNIWTQKSSLLANQTDYLDQLYKIYPMANNLKREISDSIKSEINKAISARDNNTLLRILLQQTDSKKIVFPIKDSYVAFLKHDNTAIVRNPNTVARIAGILKDKIMFFSLFCDNVIILFIFIFSHIESRVTFLLDIYI